ncbi:MAG: proprotein convertase P-domain-containing protein, partial [Thermoanaerobaculia bacterium]
MLRRLLATLALAYSTHVLASDDLRLDRVQESLTGTWRHYQQYIDGVPVLGGERMERTTRGGGVEVVYDSRVERPPTRRATPGEVAGRSTLFVVRDGFARLVLREINFDSPLRPYAVFTDVETGEVIRREPLFFQAGARVFDGNPVAKLNDPSLQDQNDSASAVPAAAYTTVELPDLAPATPLTGPNARIVDIEAPFTPHADPSQSLMFDRSQKEFEEVNAYYHVDKTQRYLQSLGYTGSRQLVAYSIPIDPHAADGVDTSYYIPGTTAGQGALFFGDGGTDDAEDSDLMVHEYGHAIQDWIAPGVFAGANASESRAMGEGFGDYWAFSARYPATIASGRDPFCLADWDARCANDDPSQGCGYALGSNCLRRVDSTKTMSDFLRVGGAGTEHANGEIWSSALREIYVALVNRYGLAGGKRAADTIVIESHFGAPPNPTYRVMAERMLDADRLLYGGANADAICAAMTVRGIVATCDLLPRGERTLFQSPQQAIVIPDQDPAGIESQLVITDAREIAKIYVHVDIAHPARGDLNITLVAPDGREVALQQSSFDRSADVHATYGLDALPAQPLDVLNGMPAAGTWRLRVADVLPQDAGTLLSWSLLIQFVGDAPSNVRPASSPGAQFI